MKKFFDHIADHVLDFIISAIVSLLGTHIATRSMQIIDQLSEESTKVVSGIFCYLWLCVSSSFAFSEMRSTTSIGFGSLK